MGIKQRVVGAPGVNRFKRADGAQPSASPRPVFTVWPLTSPSTAQESGSGAHGRAFRVWYSLWRSFCAPPVSVAQSTGHTPSPCCPVEPQHGRFRVVARGFPQSAVDQGICALTREPAGLSDALGDVGTESTPGGHRRPTCPRSGTGSRMGDGADYAGDAAGGDEKLNRE